VDSREVVETAAARCCFGSQGSQAYPVVEGSMTLGRNVRGLLVFRLGVPGCERPPQLGANGDRYLQHETQRSGHGGLEATHFAR
jgi:hypothetical protein